VEEKERDRDSGIALQDSGKKSQQPEANSRRQPLRGGDP
jgi:hypothetical protein